MLKGVPPVAVTFEMDAHHVLNVSAELTTDKQIRTVTKTVTTIITNPFNDRMLVTTQ